MRKETCFEVHEKLASSKAFSPLGFIFHRLQRSNPSSHIFHRSLDMVIKWCIFFFLFYKTVELRDILCSTLMLYKELSSTIFQSLSVSESVSQASVTPV